MNEDNTPPKRIIELGEKDTALILRDNRTCEYHLASSQFRDEIETAGRCYTVVAFAFLMENVPGFAVECINRAEPFVAKRGKETAN